MIENLYEFDNVEEHKGVPIMVCNLTKGFCWWDENGERHDEDGFHFPEMKLVKANVQILHGKERSAGWQPMFQD